MRTRLAALVAAFALAIAALPWHHSYTATADGVCPMGSNWDNAIHLCK